MEAASADALQDLGSLPGVYDGIPSEMIPAAVQDIVDYDAYWKVVPLEEEGNEISERQESEDTVT